MTTIFLSYARDDDEPFVWRLYEDLTRRGFDVWFDRVSMPSRGLTLHQEIRDAIAARDRLVLVIGPRAAASAYVEQEWQFAWYQAEKVVTPVLRVGDYPLVPDELKLLHCEDFRDDTQYAHHLRNLLRQLSEPAPPMGKLIAVPSLPPHFLSRGDRLRTLRDALRADLEGPVVISGAAARVGLHGMGGIGKSVLAAAMGHDRFVRQAFGDGIVWARLGPLRSVADVMRDVHRDLGGDGAFTTEHEGRTRLKEMLRQKAVLLILDDVWRRSDVAAFDVLGPRCRVLITTRDAGLLTSLGGTHHLVELLTDQEAIRLLAVSAGVAEEELPDQATDIVSECGRLPLAVALCGALVRRGLAWERVLGQLRQARVDRIADRHAVEPQHQSVWHAIHVGVEALDPVERERFLDLCVFPPDETTPEVAAAVLWKQTGELDSWESEELLTLLGERSLVQISRIANGPTAARRFNLHDLIYDYVQRIAGEMSQRHSTLVAAYGRKCPHGWWAGPNDGYFLDHLRNHLLAAGRGGELADLLHELRWLEAKTAAGLAFDLAHDFSAAIGALPAADNRHRILCLLKEALGRELHFIHRHREDYPQALFQCLWNWCWWYDCADAARHYEAPAVGWKGSPPWQQSGPKLCELLERWRTQKARAAADFVWLRSLRPPPVHLGMGLKAILRGHAGKVLSVSVSPDGRRIASGSSDSTLRVWDAVSGSQLLCMRDHEGAVLSVAFCPQGRRIASGAEDKTLRVWDAESGASITCFQHDSDVVSVAFCGGGDRIVSGCSTGVRVWDLKKGSPVLCHTVSALSVAASSDGRYIASGGVDKKVRVWESDGTALFRSFSGHENPARSIAFTPDGRRILSGERRWWFPGQDNNSTIRLWDIESGAELRSFGCYTKVNSVALSPDGRQFAHSYDSDHVLVRNMEDGSVMQHFRNPHRWDAQEVTTVAFLADGQSIVCGTSDWAVQIWHTAMPTEVRPLREQGEVLHNLCFSSDGKYVAFGGRDALRIWNVESVEEIACLRGDCYLPPASHQDVVAWKTSKKTLRVWNFETNTEALSIKLGPEDSCTRGEDYEISAAAFSENGERIVVGTTDGTMSIWSAETAKCLRYFELPYSQRLRAFRSVAFSADDRRVVSGHDDGEVCIWDAASDTDPHRLSGHQSRVFQVAFSPNASKVFSASFGTMRIWDVDSACCAEVIDGGGDIAALAADGGRYRWQALTSIEEVRLRDAISGKTVAWFPASAHRIAVQPSGHTWAAVSGNYFYLVAVEHSHQD